MSTSLSTGAAGQQPEPADHSAGQPSAADDGGGIFVKHPWTVPAGTVVAVVVIFAAMVLLTWAAGGSTPFGG